MEEFKFKIINYPEILNDELFIPELIMNGSVYHFEFLFNYYDPVTIISSNTKKTILHYMVIYRRLDLLTNFIGIKDLAVRRDIDGMSILHWACFEGLTDMSKFIRQRIPILENVADNDGKLPIDYEK